MILHFYGYQDIKPVHWKDSVQTFLKLAASGRWFSFEKQSMKHSYTVNIPILHIFIIQNRKPTTIPTNEQILIKKMRPQQTNKYSQLISLRILKNFDSGVLSYRQRTNLGSIEKSPTQPSRRNLQRQILITHSFPPNHLHPRSLTVRP